MGPSELLEMALRRLPGRHRLVRIFVAELLEIEPDAIRDLERAGDGVRIAREEPRHLGPALHVPLAVRLEPVARFRNCALLADAGEHVGERSARGIVIEHVVGGDERRAKLARKMCQLGEAALLVAAVVKARTDMNSATRGTDERGNALAEGSVHRPRRQGDEHLPLGRGENFLERDMTLAL